MSLPNKDEIKGKVDQAKGAVKEKAGNLTNNPELEQEGRNDRTHGQVQENIGTARRKVGETIEEIGKKVGR